jgi:hypothetical protein
VYRIDTTSEFDEDVDDLDPAVAQRFIPKLEWLAEHPISALSPPSST